MEVKEFIRLEDEIKQILIDDQKARNDDMYLYWVYCDRQFRKKDVAFGYEELGLVFHNSSFRKAHNIKTFMAVERARRKIQAQCPELANDRVKNARAKEKEDYKEYARL